MKHFPIAMVLTLFCVTDSIAQSPWSERQGHGYFKISETIINSDDFYDASGTVIPTRTAGVYISALYGQFGFTNRLTGLLYFPFFYRNTLNEQREINSGITQPGDESNTIGDTNVGLSYGLLQNNPFVLSISLIAGLPLGTTTGGDTQVLQSGDGEFNQLIRLNAGYSFTAVPVYAAAYVGFNNRTKGFSDEIRAGFEAGVTFWRSLTVAMKLRNLSSLENGDTINRQTGLFSNNIEYLSFGPELSYTYYQNVGVSFGFRGLASGQNIFASPSYSFGLFYDF